MSNSIDSHKKSISEALINSFGGYPIGYALGIIILPLSVGWIQEDPLTVNLVITFIYASVSFARSYFLRRIFEKFGYDDNFIRLLIILGDKIYHKFPKFMPKRSLISWINLRNVNVGRKL